MIPVIYWSGTGNTKTMSEVVADCIKSAGQEAALYEVSEITAAEAAGYDALALGCPAMGAEVLEESEFEPFFQELEGSLAGKRVALFGSYGWGGTYMQDWEARVKDAGAELVAEGVLSLDAPDEEAVMKCMDLGKALAK